MTDEKLHKMQQESFRRYVDNNFDFYDGKLTPKRQPRKKHKKNVLPDLMAAQITLPCTSQEKIEIPIIKKQEVMSKSIYDSMYDKPYVPKPVQDKKYSYMHKGVAPDLPKEKQPRPPAVYSNSKSHYGIYDELKEEMFRKNG